MSALMSPGTYENPYKGPLPSGDGYKYVTMSLPLAGLKYKSNEYLKLSFNRDDNYEYKGKDGKKRDNYYGYIQVDNNNIVGEVEMYFSADTKYDGSEPLLLGVNALRDSSDAWDIFVGGTFDSIESGYINYLGRGLSNSKYYKYIDLWITTPTFVPVPPAPPLPAAQGVFLSGTVHVTMKLYPKFGF